jgi:hypothetical protein
MNILYPCLSFLILFTGCHKKEECIQNKMADLQLTEDDLKINPYSGNEILIFKSSGGDTIYFSSGHRKTESYVTYEIDFETARIDHDGCQGDYFQSQFNWMQKYDSSSNSCLEINLSFRYSIPEPRTDKAFSLFFWIKDSKLIFFRGLYSFQAGVILNDSTRSQYPLYRDSIVSYHPIISLGPRQFNNVYELYCNNPDDRDTAWISTAYYNLIDGLVGFKTTYGKVWYLNKTN